MRAGADVTIINGVGHDAIYAAEASGKGEVAEWLLREGKGLESCVAGGRGGGEMEGREEGDKLGEQVGLEGEGTT